MKDPNRQPWCNGLLRAWRTRRRVRDWWRWLLPLPGFAGLLVGLSGCARDLPGENPPERAFYFPISVTTSSDGHYAYVVSSNFDLKYNAGWISVVDLDKVIQNVQSGVADSTDAILADGLKVLALAGEMALFDRAQLGGQGTLAVVPHRGIPTLTLVEILEDGAKLSCGDPEATKDLNKEEQDTDCDADHLTRIDPDETFSDADDELDLEKLEVADPYVVEMLTRADPASSSTVCIDDSDCTVSGETCVDTECRLSDTLLAAVGHLTAGRETGRLSLFELPDTDPPSIVAKRSIDLGLRTGVTGLAVHPERGAGHGPYLAATSRAFGSDPVRSTLYSIDVGRVLEDKSPPLLRHSVYGEVGGFEMVAVAFSGDGRFAYATNRSPDSVVVFDAGLHAVELSSDPDDEPDIWPRFTVVGATPIPKDPSGVLFIDQTARVDGPSIVVVASLNSDSVFLLMPQGNEARVAGRLDGVGMGPFALAHTQHVDASGQRRDLLLVATFFDHGLAVYDITPREPGQFGPEPLAHIRSDKTKPTSEVR